MHEALELVYNTCIIIIALVYIEYYLHTMNTLLREQNCNPQLLRFFLNKQRMCCIWDFGCELDILNNNQYPECLHVTNSANLEVPV